jgi:hypothetical protein
MEKYLKIYKIKMLKNISLIFFSFLFFANISFAEISVSVKDTNVRTGDFLIPISGKTDDFSGNLVEYTFLIQDIEWNNFEIVDVLPNFSAEKSDFNFGIKYSPTSIVISSEKFPSNFDGKIFDLKMRLYPKIGFYDATRKMKILPYSVKITKNGIDSLVELNSEPAIITIDTTYLQQTFYESLSLNYPNPFSAETNVFFSILEKTPIKFHLHSYSGEIMQMIPNENISDENIDKMMDFYFEDAFNNVLEVDENYEFTQGLYKLVLRPNYHIMPMGQYRLLLTTNNSKNSINISFIK